VTTATRTRAAKQPTVDAACADAVDLARTVAEELASPDAVGDHLGVEPDGDRVATHYFACTSSAYVGWRWAVTVARAPRAKKVTVDEAVLLPGADALLAPEWVPWSQRLRPGDLGVGDLLPTREDDERLQQGYAGGTEPEVDDDAAAHWELGLGRARVLSPIGRDDAVDRWYSGERGPSAPIAEVAPAQCSTCGFFVTLGGSLRQVFGVCANEYAPDDGRVVSVDHGCGAHSEAAVVRAGQEVTAPVIDEIRYDVIALHPVDHQPGSVSDASPGEDLGHS
jgi:hypothetical protein